MQVYLKVFFGARMKPHPLQNGLGLASCSPILQVFQPSSVNKRSEDCISYVSSARHVCNLYIYEYSGQLSKHEFIFPVFWNRLACDRVQYWFFKIPNFLCSSAVHWGAYWVTPLGHVTCRRHKSGCTQRLSTQKHNGENRACLQLYPISGNI